MRAYAPGGDPAWPARAVDLAFWLVYIADHVKVETAQQYLGAVKMQHFNEGLQWPDKPFELALINRVIDGLYDKHGKSIMTPKQQVNPLALRMFCKYIDSRSHKWRLFKLVAAIMCYRGRRGGECLVVCQTKSAKHLLRRNFARNEEDNGFRLKLYDVKNYKYRLDYDVLYPDLPGDVTNIATLLRDYEDNFTSAASRNPSDFLFVLKSGKALNAKTFYKWTKEAFDLVGLKVTAKIGASSYRAGAATEAARIGFNTARIQQLGDWLSEDSIKHYATLNDHDIRTSVQRLAGASLESLNHIEAAGLNTASGAYKAASLVPALTSPTHASSRRPQQRTRT
jgi:hypothetical protein